MIPILIGAAAAALLLSGCSRDEEPAPPPAPEPPRSEERSPPPLPSPSRPLDPGLLRLPTHSPFLRAPSLAGERCRPDAPRPERFAIHDARAEYCRLHELLRGAECRVDASGQLRVSEERTMPSVLALFTNLEDRSGFGAVVRHPELRPKLAALEGLQTYLHSGRPCEFDNLGDLMDLMEAYSLFHAAARSPQSPLRGVFHEGRVGCILRRTIHRAEGVHDHEVNGARIHHTESHDLDRLVTAATVALEGLAPSTPVSDCLELP